MLLTPATSHQLKRSTSQETLATELSEVSSSPSLAYPSAPLNTPATPSIADGDEEEEDGDLMIRSAADIASVANRLQQTTPPTSPGTGDAEDEDLDEAADAHDPFREGKAHLRAHVRRDSDLTRQLFKSPERHSQRGGAKKHSRHESLKKSALAATQERTNTPTLLRHVNTVINLSSPHQLTPSLSTNTLEGSASPSSTYPVPAPSFNTAASTVAVANVAETPSGSPDDLNPPHLRTASSQTFEFTTWGPVAEEDTSRALKRMAMLARDEHTKDPRRSVEEYYSERLARLIEEAEVEFDATHLR